MLPLSTFDLNKEPLLDLLQKIQGGKLQLADFQRDWCWDDQRIRLVLASISLGFPVGTLMLLQQENAQFRLKPRLVEGVALDCQPSPQALILDGQQRLTGLFMALLSSHPVVINRGPRYAPDQRWYYFDMAKALQLPERDRMASLVGFKDGHHPGREAQFQAHLFPLSCMFRFLDWRGEYHQYWQHDADKINLINDFETMVVKRFEHYQMGLYILSSELPKEAVCQIFVNHNARPCELTHFDLLTSEYASQDFNLRTDWEQRQERFADYPVLRLFKSTDLLQAVSLLSTYQQRLAAKEAGDHAEPLPRIACNRQEIIHLGLADYQQWVEPIAKGLEQATKFLHTQGIFDADEVPYLMQLIVLAPLMAILGDAVKLDTVRQKLEQWFYCGAASGTYSRSREATAAKDLIEMPVWVWDNDGAIPTSLREAAINWERLQSCVSSQGATYRAVSALLRRDGALDFLTGEAITEAQYCQERIENHHIFPQKWCRQQGIPRARYNSVVNKTPLTSWTNRFLGSSAPSVYLAKLEEQGIARERVDEMLRSHRIEPDLLRQDDFEGFFEQRSTALLGRLHEAMGKE